MLSATYGSNPTIVRADSRGPFPNTGAGRTGLPPMTQQAAPGKYRTSVHRISLEDLPAVRVLASPKRQLARNAREQRHDEEFWNCLISDVF